MAGNLRTRGAGVIASLVSMMWAALAFAQTSTPDVNVDVGGGGANTGAFPNWMLWVGIGVFLLIVIALTTRGRRA